MTETIDRLLSDGWIWKKVDGFGKILTSSDDKVYPLTQIEKNMYVPEFLRNVCNCEKNTL